MKRLRRSPFEVFAVAAAVAASLAISISFYAARADFEKGRVLASELSAIRSSVLAYIAVRGATPDALADLFRSGYETGGEQRPFLHPQGMLEDGGLVDPFGNPYLYRRESGWVFSSTPGYERW
ncbi:MAG: hypothetical protein JXA24_01585 [Proteobacteria bacterium]|nr:hypothetical protein [Pseudomonadota bacterium]